MEHEHDVTFSYGVLCYAMVFCSAQMYLIHMDDVVHDGWMFWKEINTSGYWGKRMYLHLMMFLFAPGSLAKIIVISLYFLLSLWSSGRVNSKN